MYIDSKDIILKKYDIINIHQTVNGSSKFIIMDIINLDIRYVYDIRRRYEYDMSDLLLSTPYPDYYTIIGNIKGDMSCVKPLIQNSITKYMNKIEGVNNIINTL